MPNLTAIELHDERNRRFVIELSERAYKGVAMETTTLRTRANPKTGATEHKGYCNSCKRNVHKIWMPDSRLGLVQADMAQHNRMFARDHRQREAAAVLEAIDMGWADRIVRP